MNCTHGLCTIYYNRFLCNYTYVNRIFEQDFVETKYYIL